MNKALDIEVRWARKDDGDAWLAMRQALWPECPDGVHEADMLQAMASGGGAFLAMTPLSGPAGFAEVSLRREHVEGASSSPVAYLEGWFVAPPTRGEGVGRALVEAAVRWARETGASELASDTELENEEGRSAHQGLGFSEVGRSVHYVRRL